MITEIAVFTIKPGMETQFEQGVSKAMPLFLRSRGCHGLRLMKSIEQPAQYTLLVNWDTVEDHMVHFRESEAFTGWRALVADTFAAPPQVHHAGQVV